MARARFTAVVDLPTPPLPDATAIMCLMPWISGLSKNVFGPFVAPDLGLGGDEAAPEWEREKKNRKGLCALLVFRGGDKHRRSCE